MKQEKIDQQAVIAGEGVELRPLRDSDTPLIERFAGDERVALMTTTIPFPLPEGAAEEFVARARDADRIEDVWAIDASGAGGPAFVGLISLKYLDREQSEVGYWVAPDYWNRGYASAALNALLSANPHANRSVVACVFQDNPASARVLTGAGFACLGEAEAFSLARGRHVPTWTYLKTL